MRTAQGVEMSEVITFRRGLPQGDALCPRLFTLCINPVSWMLKATEGYRLSKPIGKGGDSSLVYRRFKDLCSVKGEAKKSHGCGEGGDDGYRTRVE